MVDDGWIEIRPVRHVFATRFFDNHQSREPRSASDKLCATEIHWTSFQSLIFSNGTTPSVHPWIHDIVIDPSISMETYRGPGNTRIIDIRIGKTGWKGSD